MAELSRRTQALLARLHARVEGDERHVLLQVGEESLAEADDDALEDPSGISTRLYSIPR